MQATCPSEICAPDGVAMRMPLNNESGHISAVGFGTRIPDAAVTITATRDALEAGFRHLS
jgi:aldehyde reductase